MLLVQSWYGYVFHLKIRHIFLDLLELIMKKISLFFLINFILLSYTKAEILILSCGYVETPGKEWTLHIDTVKQQLIQTNTLKLNPVQVALTEDSKFTIIKSSYVTEEELKKYNYRFSDTAIYTESQMFKEINRYSGDFNMYFLITDKKNYDFFFNKLKKIKNSKNLFREMEIFAEKNDRPGFRYDDFGSGVCKKSKKQF